jgi:hypothetical protein
MKLRWRLLLIVTSGIFLATHTEGNAITGKTLAQSSAVNWQENLANKNIALPFKIPQEIVESPSGELSNVPRRFTKFYFFQEFVLTPDGTTLIVAYYDIVYSDAVIKFWKAKTGQEIHTQYIDFDPTDKLTGEIKLSPDANSLTWFSRDEVGNIGNITKLQLKAGEFVRP